jgi:threonine/homoserine/homoserine lactone efflux protein
MEFFSLLLRGIAAGVAISAPVGPINVICVSRTVTKGWWSGIISGLGAAVADSLYGSIAAFSISIVIDFLYREQSNLRFFGGFLLIALGIWYYRKKAPEPARNGRNSAEHTDFTSTFILALTNPTTVLSFLAVLAVLGLGKRSNGVATLGLCVGIFAGSMTWWILLTGVTHKFRSKFDNRAMAWMNRIGGLAIGAFGIIMIALSGKF